MAREDEVRIGAAVRFRLGSGSRDGIVKEDRGGIGRGGRRLYLIEFNPGHDPESGIELPAEKLEILAHHHDSTNQPVEAAS